MTVNGSTASRYNDNTFALAGFTVTNGNNTFAAIAQDSYNRKDTNSVVFNLPATVSYIYDLNGNLTSDSTRGFEYDDENELIRVTVTNSWKSEFTYDGRMRRRIRKEFTWQTSAWLQTNEVRYIYDGNLEIQWRDGNNLPTLTVTRGYDLSGSLQGAGGIGGLLARTDAANGQTAYFQADGNGNITALINAQQVVVAKYLYDAFGNVLSKSGPLADANTYRFSSQEYHQASGLVLYRYRAYDPNLQRWLNRDPLVEQGGFNLYEFVENSPVSFVDTDGRSTYRASNWPYVPINLYPPGFALAQRDIRRDHWYDLITPIANLFGGEHTYVQYVDDGGNKWGWGWGGGKSTGSELYFRPNSVKLCKKTGNPLKYGK